MGKGCRAPKGAGGLQSCGTGKSSPSMDGIVLLLEIGGPTLKAGGTVSPAGPKLFQNEESWLSSLLSCCCDKNMTEEEQTSYRRKGLFGADGSRGIRCHHHHGREA